MKYTILQFKHPKETTEDPERFEAALNKIATSGLSLHSTQYLPGHPNLPAGQEQGHLVLIFEQIPEPSKRSRSRTVIPHQTGFR